MTLKGGKKTRKKAGSSAGKSKSRRKKSAPARANSPVRSSRRRIILSLFLLALVSVAAYTVYLDYVVRSQFEGKKWALPARVYARPLELYVGLQISRADFEKELVQVGYRYRYDANQPGTYTRNSNSYTLMSRPFTFWDGKAESTSIQVSITDGVVDSLNNHQTGMPVSLFRLEPAVISRIYPTHKEDRVLVKLEQVPAILVDGLIAVEDHSYYEHHGINPRAIARAAWANIRAGAAVQGGSTLTQQLVKNFFLTNERSLWRKANEAIMSLLLEAHYSKDDILEAYLNEIYLGQDTDRAIHGFGLASHFYFDKPLDKLNISELATLIALVRGPSYYDPKRHPKRLVKRRNLVLELMQRDKLISKETMYSASNASLNVVRSPSTRTSSYPGFIDLVKRQLHDSYRYEDLTSEGLQIFTTFDPFIQEHAETALSHNIRQLDQARKLKGQLQGAVLVTNSVNGEVVAVLGDRNPRFNGFNRALDASRQVGSLIKPAVYLTAIMQPGKYTLSSLVDDSVIRLKGEDSNIWTPKNYDGVSHGKVPLIRALVHSYNQATVRLGMALGFEAIQETLKRLGVRKAIPPYPSMLLGSVNLTPFEVTQMYQTFASGGFYTPLKAVREVLTVEGIPLKRYPVDVRQTIRPEFIQVLNSALAEVVRSGTARGVNQQLPQNIVFAGKTGTTNDLKDSWFAGYSGDYLAVVWMGADDNSSIKLSGSSGALRTWADIMSVTARQSILTEPGDELDYHWIDMKTGMLSEQGCASAVKLAFIEGTAPQEQADCSNDGSSDRLPKSKSWFERLFN